MSTAPMAAIRPVNSSHWRTDLVTTWAASTSGGGGGGASAWLLPQAVMTVAMTTMAMAERLARSDGSKEWRCGTSVLLTGSNVRLILKLTSTKEKSKGSFCAGALSCYWLRSNGVLQSMDLPSRSRASHAVQYVCPEWTWPADELIHIREMSERTSVPSSSLRYYEKLGLITSERETSGSQRRYSKATFYKII